VLHSYSVRNSFSGMFGRFRNFDLSLAIVVCICVSAVSISRAHAQMAGPGSSGQSAGTLAVPKYTLSGTVVNSVTGDPISRALVQLVAERQRSVMTDEHGRFQIEDLPETRALIQQVRKPGYFEEQQISRRRRGAIEVGPNAAPLVIKLVPESIIVGHVTDENREPIEGVPVKITSVRIQNGRKQWVTRQVGRTNPEGEFRAANLQPGTYYVSAGPSRIGAGLSPFVPAPNEMSFPLAYYPGVSEMPSAGSFQLSAGQFAQADFALTPAPSFSISGIVTGYAEGNQPNLQFVNRAGNDVLVSNRFEPSTGKFEARVFAGAVIIKAHAQDPTGRTQYAEITTNVLKKVENIHLALVENGIPIIVQKQRTKPASAYANDARSGGRAIFADPALEARMSIEANVQLVSVDPARRDAQATIQGADGQLMVHDAENGRYRVQIMPMGAWYVQSATHAGTDLLSEELAVTQGESRPIEIVLRDDFATLTATVQGWGDDADRSTQFVVVPQRAPLNVRFNSSSGRGDVGLGLFAPGEYRVYAFDRIDGLEYTNPEVLRAYDSKAASVTLQPDQKTSVTVELIRRGE
jgi:hypothetical protein